MKKTTLKEAVNSLIDSAANLLKDFLSEKIEKEKKKENEKDESL